MRPAGSEQKTSRLQATACEDVTAGLNRDSLALQSAAIQALGTGATAAGNDFSAGEAGYHTNASRAPERVAVFAREICGQRPSFKRRAAAGTLPKPGHHGGRKMWHLRGIECRPAAPKPAASPLVIGQQLIISGRPGHIADMIAAFEVNPVIGHATTSPDGRGATELAAYGQGHRRMKCGVPFRRLGELLDVRVELLTAALDQHHIEALASYLSRDRDAGRPSPNHG